MKKQFEKEYPQLFDDIYRFTLCRIQGNKEAEDLVSETFLTAYEKLGHYNPALGSLRTWIFQIAKNKIIDYWRKRKIVVDLEEIMNVFNPFEEKLLKEDVDQEILLKHIYSNLSPEMKILFNFRYIDDLSYSEIAELTGKKPDCLRKSFSRMHSKLGIELQNL